MSDRETLERAEKHYGKNDKFSNLYNGKSVFGNEERDEYGLMVRLALFCGNDEEQLLRLFKSSGQFRDEKPNAYYMQMAQKGLRFISATKQSFSQTNGAGEFAKGKVGINSKR